MVRVHMLRHIPMPVGQHWVILCTENVARVRLSLAAVLPLRRQAPDVSFVLRNGGWATCCCCSSAKCTCLRVCVHVCVWLHGSEPSCVLMCACVCVCLCRALRLGACICASLLLLLLLLLLRVSDCLCVRVGAFGRAQLAAHASLFPPTKSVAKSTGYASGVWRSHAGTCPPLLGRECGWTDRLRCTAKRAAARAGKVAKRLAPRHAATNFGKLARGGLSR